MGNKEKKIFISHATCDKEIVKEFIKMLEQNDIPKDSIFCSSVEECRVQVGGNFRPEIKRILKMKPHCVYMVSSAYYQRHICLNEMGAAWIQNLPHTIIILPGSNAKEKETVYENGEIHINLNDDSQKVRHDIKQFLMGFNNDPKESTIDSFVNYAKNSLPMAIILDRRKFGI